LDRSSFLETVIIFKRTTTPNKHAHKIVIQQNT
jgi:hypothetical protein